MRNIFENVYTFEHFCNTICVKYIQMCERVPKVLDKDTKTVFIWTLC